MKLITAIAALALVAGSMDVGEQKRGDASKTPGGGKKPGAQRRGSSPDRPGWDRERGVDKAGHLKTAALPHASSGRAVFLCKFPPGRPPQPHSQRTLL